MGFVLDAVRKSLLQGRPRRRLAELYRLFRRCKNWNRDHDQQFERRRHLQGTPRNSAQKHLHSHRVGGLHPLQFAPLKSRGTIYRAPPDESNSKCFLLPYRAGRALEASAPAAAAEVFIGGFSPCAGAAWPLGPPAAFELPGIGISSLLRSVFSSLSRMSLFSFRNTRAFSRPWPMRSPPKLIHVPLFSSTPFSTPRSIKSPSREIPSP